MNSDSSTNARDVLRQLHLYFETLACAIERAIKQFDDGHAGVYIEGLQHAKEAAEKGAALVRKSLNSE